MLDFNNFSFTAYCLVFFSHSHSGMVLLGLGHRQITAELGKCYTRGLGVWTCADVLLLASGTVVLSCCRQTVVGFQWWPQTATGTQLRKGHSLAVETSSTCTLSCTFPKSNKGHINSSLCYCCGEYIPNTHYFKKYFVARYADCITFHCVLEKTLEFPCQIVFAVQKGKKPNTETVVNSAAHCNSASKYHSCRLWMFCPYHEELTLQPVSSFLALEESIDYSQVIVLATLYESNIPQLPLTFLCLKQQVLPSVQSPAVNGDSYSTASSFHLLLIAKMLVL